MNLKENKEKFLKSNFYKKYKDTYWCDSVLKEVFGIKMEIHEISNFNNLSYEDIYKLNIRIMTDFFSDAFILELAGVDKNLMWKILEALYLDPDQASIKIMNGITCSADGLISRNRISRHVVNVEDYTDEYALTRKHAIVHFPREKGGINWSRAKAFGDRIDHTLLDLKNYFDLSKRNTCKLKKVYELPITKKWLSTFHDFTELIDALGVKNILTNNKYEIYDLGKGKGVLLQDYCESYSWQWSDEYYANLREIIVKFNSCK